MNLFKKYSDIIISITCGVIIIIAFTFLTFCSYNFKKPLLNHSQRVSFIETYGSDISISHKEAFKKGIIVEGMNYYYLLLIYGEPDLTILCPKNQNYCDKVLIYQTNDNVTVGSVSIKNDTIIKVNGQLTREIN